jgi:uncharacterized protein (DUF433 family)
MGVQVFCPGFSTAFTKGATSMTNGLSFLSGLLSPVPRGSLNHGVRKMPPTNWREYIVTDPSILGGKPILKGTRLSVEFVLELLAAGWDRESLRSDYPNLTEDGIRAVLAYAAETFREERFYLLPPEKASV